MTSAAEYLRRVIRVFPDYADTVIWFAPGPVDYDLAKISSELRARMVAWEESWYAGLTDNYGWESPEIERATVEEGESIARALSDEIGDLLEVEFDTVGAPARLRTRGSGRGTNPAAREAFRRMIEEDLEDERAIAAAKANGDMIRFVAYAPQTGEFFAPPEK